MMVPRFSNGSCTLNPKLLNPNRRPTKPAKVKPGSLLNMSCPIKIKVEKSPKKLITKYPQSRKQEATTQQAVKNHRERT